MRLFYWQGDTSGDYKKLLLKFCGGSDWKGNSVYYIMETFYKYQFSALSICTIHKLQICMPCQYFQCNVYLLLRTSIFSYFFLYTVCTKSFIFFHLWYLCWICELNINGHTIDLQEVTFEFLELYIFKMFYFSCANMIRYLMISGTCYQLIVWYSAMLNK